MVKPNLLQLSRASQIITDPKGEILRCCGGMLKAHGYRIRVLNLVEMEQSNGYNPFRYIRSETDIVKLVTNLINNTTPKTHSPVIRSGRKPSLCTCRPFFFMCGRSVKWRKGISVWFCSFE